MALIKCPECGSEISDKAPACIHCGFPLKQNDSSTNCDIVALFESVLAGRKANDIYNDVIQKIAIIKSSYNDTEANDIIAKSIIDGLSKILNQLSWMNVKQYCEIIDFPLLSADAMDYFSNQLYSIISIKKIYDDGSGGYTYITPFFYAEYMVIQYGSENNKDKLMDVLRHPYWGKQTGYDYVVSRFNQHGSGNTVQQIAAVQSSTQSTKCSVCGSTKINKISTANRLTSVFAFGLASSKIGKQYECKSCKHKW